MQRDRFPWRGLYPHVPRYDAVFWRIRRPSRAASNTYPRKSLNPKCIPYLAVAMPISPIRAPGMNRRHIAPAMRQMAHCLTPPPNYAAIAHGRYGGSDWASRVSHSSLVQPNNPESGGCMGCGFWRAGQGATTRNGATAQDGAAPSAGRCASGAKTVQFTP